MKISKHSTDILNAANKGLVIFGEGYTEYFFYKKCISEIRKVSNSQVAVLRVENVEGIGNFIHYPLNRMKNFIIPNNKGILFTVLLCYDTDVYEFQRKPTFEWSKVVKGLKNRFVTNIQQVKQEKSIEDWILKDPISILDYLKLDRETNIPDGRGIDVLKTLYLRANKVYVHGDQRDSQKIIDALNMNTIISSLWNELQPILVLYNVYDMSLFQ